MLLCSLWWSTVSSGRIGFDCHERGEHLLDRKRVSSSAAPTSTTALVNEAATVKRLSSYRVRCVAG